jgi:hypothetical protein
VSRLIDRLTQQNSSGLAFVNLWNNQMCPSVEGAFAGQQSQLDTINAILDPNTLTPDKKPIWIFMESYLTGEQSDIDTRATAYGITTEKTAYDNAISALTAYLATLTTPVAWNNTSGNTTIVDATFRTNFTNVLTAKQALLDKMHDSALALANTAQSTANTAQSTATTAQSTATTAQSTATSAQSTANTANTNATAAQTTANTANTNATAAQTAAASAKRNDKISGSWTSPGTILSGADAGSDATITIANHTRYYGDNTSVSVTGGSITGLFYSTTYYLYYDDSNTTGGSVTWHATLDPNTALPNRTAGRHFAGSIITPAPGGAATNGGVAFGASVVTRNEIT